LALLPNALAPAFTASQPELTALAHYPMSTVSRALPD
jgi:hypothetical protein